MDLTNNHLKYHYITIYNPPKFIHPSPSPPTMEEPQHDFSSTVDTSRPFSSVKEAVAIFGERLLLGEIYSPKPNPKPNSHFSLDTTTTTTTTTTPSPSPRPMKTHEENNTGLVDVIKKLETELEQTKLELKLLKERGSETEVALATLNAELHKNMSKLAQAEAAAAGKAAATKTVRFEISEDKKDDDDGEAEKKKEYAMRKNVMDSQSLAYIMSLGENDHLFIGGKKGRKHKHKPIIPLVGDFFFKRKNSSPTNHHNPLYASPF